MHTQEKKDLIYCRRACLMGEIISHALFLCKECNVHFLEQWPKLFFLNKCFISVSYKQYHLYLGTVSDKTVITKNWPMKLCHWKSSLDFFWARFLFLFLSFFSFMESFSSFLLFYGMFLLLFGERGSYF